MWATSEEGRRCLTGQAAGEYLTNRLRLAFQAAYNVARDTFSRVPHKEEGVSVVEVANMWRSGDFVYMVLGGEEHMFSIADILALKDLSE
jgi:hypothetical protein